MGQQENSDNLLTAFEASKYLDINFDTFFAFVNSGYICYIMRDRAHRFKQAELDRFKMEFLCKNRSDFTD